MFKYICESNYSKILNHEFFIVRRIAFSNRKSFSAFIIRIAIAAVALSVSTMIIATSLVNGFQKEIRNKVFGFWGHVRIANYSLSQSYKEQGIYKYQDFYTNKAKLPQVRHIQTMAVKGALLKTKDNFDGIVLKGVDQDFDWNVFQQYLLRGSIFSGDSLSLSKQILISRITADRLQIDTGAKLIVNILGNEMKTRIFFVKGIYETGIEEFDKEYALVPISTIQVLNNWGTDTVGGFEIFLKEENLFKSRGKAYLLTLFGALMSKEQLEQLSKDPIDDITTQINYDINNMNLEAESIKNLRPGMFDWLELQTMNELIILLLMIAVAVINMVTTLLILILDRTNMIGILKALGSSDISVRKIFLYYAGFIVGLGLLIGNFFGIGLCLLQKYFHILKLPQDSYYLSYAPVEINWGWIVSMNLATIIICLLLLILPSYIIAKISPVKAIRFS